MFLLSQQMESIKNGNTSSTIAASAAAAIANFANIFENPSLGIHPTFIVGIPPVEPGHIIPYSIGPDGSFKALGGGSAVGVTRRNTIYISPYAALNGIDYLIGIISHEMAHVYLNSIESDLNNLSGASNYMHDIQEYIAHSYEEMYYAQLGSIDLSLKEGAKRAADANAAKLPALLFSQLQPYLGLLGAALPKFPCL